MINLYNRTKPSAEVIADSISTAGVRVTTLLVVMHRFVLPEFNTHRTFCLAGDAELEFDLPTPQKGGSRRSHRVRLDTFVDRWLHGANRHGANPKLAYDLSWCEDSAVYTAKDAAEKMGMATPGPIRVACRSGACLGTKTQRSEDWQVLGKDLKAWRSAVPPHTRFDMRARLQSMRIRQVNEQTGVVQWARVKNVQVSGTKPVYEVKAGAFCVAGSLDHRVLTTAGWKTIGDLTTADFILTQKFGRPASERKDANRLKYLDGRWRAQWQREQRTRLQKENPSCRRCDNLGVEVHHVIPVYQAPERVYDPTNVTLLCSSCHQTEHKVQGWQDSGNHLYAAPAQVESVTYRGDEPTYDLEIDSEYPNFFANGVVVHNSRNSASSRAIPIRKRIKSVLFDCAFPLDWGRNKKGMQAGQPITGWKQFVARVAWRVGALLACGIAFTLDVLGLHKQIANRVLEPFLWHTVLVTSTEWDNYFAQRDSELAQPEIAAPSREMRKALAASIPKLVKKGEWHLPFIPATLADKPPTELADILMRIQISCARSARTSYLTQSGKIDYKEDLRLYNDLSTAEPEHGSPFEHACTPGSGKGNFVGWTQWRHHPARGAGQALVGFRK